MRIVISLCLVLIAGCATAPVVVRQQCYDADAQLARVLASLAEARAAGCGTPLLGAACEQQRRELARLSVVCPAHSPTLLANAVLAYDEQRRAESQQLLDLILSQPRPLPDAAVLRARIAIEEGNVPFARRLMEQQIKLVPDHAGLHETYASALYLQGQLADATGQLTMAQTLGAPRWRIAYHLGLIEEASGRIDQASRLYAESLQQNPGWTAAESRLKALRARTP